MDIPLHYDLWGMRNRLRCILMRLRYFKHNGIKKEHLGALQHVLYRLKHAVIYVYLQRSINKSGYSMDYNRFHCTNKGKFRNNNLLLLEIVLSLRGVCFFVLFIL